MHPQRTFVPLAVLLASLWSGPGWAQAPDAPPPAVAQPGAAAGTREETSDTDTTAAPAPREQRGPRLLQLDEVLVEADRPLTAASSQVIRTRDFALRPHSTTQEILNNVPGLVVVQHAGGGKAVQYFLRGFDIDHGTDFAMFTDGIPVNMVSHAHGQGYADINYLIPETVDTLQLFKGPYFVELGDFDTAGALQITTKEEFRENFFLAEGGSFDTQRYVMGGSVPLTWAKTLLAAEAYFTNGPFDNPEHYARYNVFGKLTFDPTPEQTLSVLGSVYAGDWDGSGQIPLRIVGSGPGEIGRFASLDPSEGGSSDRQNLSAIWTYTPAPGEEWSAQVWGSRYHLRLFSNFTFFRDTGLRFYEETPGSGRYVDRCAGLGNDCPDAPPAGVPLSQFIPGDGIQQDDTRLLFGGFVKWSKFYEAISAPGLGVLPMQTEFGLATRRDHIDVALQRQVRRNPFYVLNKVGIEEQSVSGWWGQQIFLTEWARLAGGVRGDVFFFDVRNRLPNQAADPNFEAVLIKGNEVAGLASPKANLVLGPWADTELYGNFGYGFHSNDARSVVLSGTDGLAQALGTELGTRTRQLERLDLAASLWLLDLDSELVFSGDGGNVDADVDEITGNFIPGPASRRWGLDFEARYQITDWLFVDYDLGWADPRFREDVCDDDDPPNCGRDIPLAPTLIQNGGLTADFTHGPLAGFAAALRFRNLGSRPATESGSFTAQGYTLLDMLLRYRWRNVEASLAFLNIADTDWRQSQFVENTCVNQIADLDYASSGSQAQPCQAMGQRPALDSFSDGIEGLTFTPGSPFNVRGGIQVFF